jgi:hypothetical protein
MNGSFAMSASYGLALMRGTATAWRTRDETCPLRPIVQETACVFTHMRKKKAGAPRRVAVHDADEAVE